MSKTTDFGSEELHDPIPMRRLPERLIASGEPVVTAGRIAELVGLSRRSIHSGLARLRADGRLFSPARGLYVAVPPEYHAWGVVPADWFIDPMMRHLNRRYYVGLLSAAAMHGAASQAPQVFQAMVDRQLADRDLGRVRLRFHVNSLLADRTVDLPLEERTTHTGTLRLSSPELTAVDLIANPHLAGGLHNIATVLPDLELDSSRLAAIARHYPRVIARRIGWLLERAEEGLDLEPLRNIAAPNDGEALPLDPHGGRNGLHDRSWGLIVNDDGEVSPP
jgi:predicted transcriptional regulator of viral defense system